jgi:hypothetical protein
MWPAVGLKRSRRQVQMVSNKNDMHEQTSIGFVTVAPGLLGGNLGATSAAQPVMRIGSRASARKQTARHLQGFVGGTRLGIMEGTILARTHLDTTST